MMALEKQDRVNLIRDASTRGCEGLFLGTVGSYTSRKTVPRNRTGCSANAFGAVLGERCTLGLGRIDVACTIFAGFVDGTAKYKGQAVEKTLKSTRKDYVVGATARYDFYGLGGMDMSADVTLLMANGCVNWLRENARNRRYEGKIRDYDRQIGISARHDIGGYGPVGIGCFGAVTYDLINQGGFVETAPNAPLSSCLMMSSICHKFLTYELGISAKTLEAEAIRLNCKFGARYAALREHGDASASILGVASDVKIYYGDKYCAIASFGGSYDFTKHWNCTFNFEGNLSKSTLFFSAAVSCGRKF
jgi:hypothetical protein